MKTDRNTDGQAKWITRHFQCHPAAGFVTWSGVFKSQEDVPKICYTSFQDQKNCQQATARQ